MDGRQLWSRAEESQVALGDTQGTSGHSHADRLYLFIFLYNST